MSIYGVIFVGKKQREKNQRKNPHHEARIKEKALVDFLREMKEVRAYFFERR